MTVTYNVADGKACYAIPLHDDIFVDLVKAEIAAGIDAISQSCARHYIKPKWEAIEIRNEIRPGAAWHRLLITVPLRPQTRTE